eukprot:13489_1
MSVLRLFLVPLMIQMCLGKLGLFILNEKGGGIYLCDADKTTDSSSSSDIKKGTRLDVGDILQIRIPKKGKVNFDYLTHGRPNGDTFHRPGGGKPLKWDEVKAIVDAGGGVILFTSKMVERAKGAHRSYTDILDEQDYYDNNMYNDERSQRSDIAYWNGNIDSSAYNGGYFSGPALIFLIGLMFCLCLVFAALFSMISGA